MRGLPPLPTDFITLKAEWTDGLARFTTSWNLFAPGSSSADAAALASLISQWFLLCLPDLLSIVPHETSCRACRCESSGPNPVVIEEPLATNAGLVGTSSVIGAASVLTWRSSDRGRAGYGMTFLPLRTDFVEDDLRTLHLISWAQLQSAARSYALHLNEIVSPDGAFCVFANVHRSRAGAPLASAEWSPVLYGAASRFVGHLGRRQDSGR